MTREQAKEILNGMSLEDCIKMWNEGMTGDNEKVSEIHEMEDDKWWDFISQKIGGYYLMRHLINSSEYVFKWTDEYFFYCVASCEFCSFDSKEELLYLIEDWFIDEIINRPRE